MDEKELQQMICELNALDELLYRGDSERAYAAREEARLLAEFDAAFGDDTEGQEL